MLDSGRSYDQAAAHFRKTSTPNAYLALLSAATSGAPSCHAIGNNLGEHAFNYNGNSRKLNGSSLLDKAKVA